MNLKPKRYYFVALFLLSTPTSLCHPPSTNSILLSLKDNVSGETTSPKYHISGEDAERRHLQSSSLLEVFTTVADSLKSKDQTRSQKVHLMSDQESKHKMASSERQKRSKKPHDKAKHKRKEERGFYVNAPNLDCSSGQIKYVVYGKFYISDQLQANVPHEDHQSASTNTVQSQGSKVRMRGQRRGGAEELWQRLRPEVECGDNTMTLTFRRRRAAQLLLHRENESSVPLSQLPSQCGYAVKTTWRELTLTALYNACHVTQQGASYVLALLWRGTPVKVSCPVAPIEPTAISPSSLCCSPYGLNVRLPAGQELRVKVGGEWTPMLLAQQCGFTLDRQNTEVLLAAPFITCGITVKDGQHTLHLQIGENTFTLACPVFDPKVPPVTHHPLARSPPTETVASFPWDPPFYLAPPYYPHPTYRHKNPGAAAQEGHIPPVFTSSTPELTMAAQPLILDAPQLDNQDHSHQNSVKRFGADTSDEILHSSQAYSDVQEQHRDTDSPVQVEAPSFQDPNNAFNPYYHYYHHPKIPHSSPPEGSDPGLVAAPEELLTEAEPTLSHLPSHDYYPHMTQGDSETLPDVYAESDAKVESSDSSGKRMMGTHVSAPPWPSVHPDHGFHPSLGEPGKIEKDVPHQFNSGVTEKPLFPGDENVEMNDLKIQSMPVTPAVLHPPLDPLALDVPTVLNLEQSSFPFLLPLSDHPSPHEYHHDLYHSYQTHYPMGPPSAEERTDLVSLHIPKHTPFYQPNTPIADEMYDIQNPYLHPYHFYYPVGDDMNPGKEPALSESWPFSDMSLAQLSRTAETSPPLPPHGSFDHLYPSIISQQHLHEPFQHPGGEGEVDLEERIDCAMGPHFFLVIPESAVQPTVPPPGPPSDVNMSCTLQKMTSEPDIYRVVLDGCDASNHDSGQAVLEFHSLQQDDDSAYENTPVRLMMDCSSSSASVGDLSFPGMDPSQSEPLQDMPTTATVQLRISTDKSFGSYHPEAHLPLSFLQGRQVYVEVRLLDPQDPDLVLLVHSCLVYTLAPNTTCLLIYDGCPSRGGAQLLPSPHVYYPHHIRRILISHFLLLPLHTLHSSSHLDDPEVYFLCVTEVCSTAEGGCVVGCINRTKDLVT
ncbi:uncharacterized protein LOC129171393 isoform X2 [Dunckerocampus dactyliophorus]|uniref:uncharacterized protein LOC129171393 isoform X2 n=1 Tax=Dunckerocampus dactyliophorus TaxID=161453 RepID=UPI0024070CDD|nr:uncharacterized protein LOC129171393 isoform X2 [Dunckerocampus dactyliophorus]